MYQKERMENILALLRRYGYVTVKFLVEELHYSRATIHRDLNALEKMGKLRRTYGGVEATQERAIPVEFRYEKEKPKKKRIGRRAAQYVCDGDTIFIDGSTTAQYMSEYLLDKKDITVLTNNMALAMLLSENGIRATVLGGQILEPPYMLGGTDTVEAAARYRADKCFFSTREVSRGGEMAYTDDIYLLMHKTMMRNARQVFYLVDSDKVDRREGRVVLGDFSLVDCVISDYDFEEATKKAFPHVDFVWVDKK